MSYNVPLVGLAVLVLVGGLVYTTTRDHESSSSGFERVETGSADPHLGPAVTNVTSDINATNETRTIVSAADESARSAAVSSTAVTNTANVGFEASREDALTSSDSSGAIAASDASVFAASLARDRLDDATINELVDALRSDPEKLAAVMNEFSAETDAERLSRLRLLLGQLDDPALVGVAESMLFSGNPDSSSEALRLLRDIGPAVPEAQEVGVSLLSSTQDAQLLVGATNILTSSASASAETTQRVVSSLTSLVQHPDASVRRASFSMLARWSDDPADASILVQGLSDADPTVRRSTAYGFVGYSHADATIINALLNTAENVSETRRVRSGAMLALKGMTLTDSQRARLQAAQSQRR